LRRANWGNAGELSYVSALSENPWIRVAGWFGRGPDHRAILQNHSRRIEAHLSDTCWNYWWAQDSNLEPDHYERRTEVAHSRKSVENQRSRLALTRFAKCWFANIVGYLLVLVREMPCERHTFRCGLAAKNLWR
jgi:hypothetical protein